MSKIQDFIKSGKLKKAAISEDMIQKEFNIGKKDLSDAKDSFADEKYKWSTIQSYYALFHAVRALIYKGGYREESHYALKIALKEIYIDTDIIEKEVFNVFEKGMNLREIADYKETYSKDGAEYLIKAVSDSIEKIGRYLFKDTYPT